MQMLNSLEIPSNQVDFNNLRREQSRTSMNYRRPSDKLNVSTHLYIDNKPDAIEEAGLNNLDNTAA